MSQRPKHFRVRSWLKKLTLSGLLIWKNNLVNMPRTILPSLSFLWHADKSNHISTSFLLTYICPLVSWIEKSILVPFNFKFNKAWGIPNEHYSLSWLIPNIVIGLIMHSFFCFEWKSDVNYLNVCLVRLMVWILSHC